MTDVDPLDVPKKQIYNNTKLIKEVVSKNYSQLQVRKPNPRNSFASVESPKFRNH
jgi:hypothetical protein